MSKAFDSIKAGLEQAIAHQADEPNDVVVHDMSAVDVKAVRNKVGMTQQAFAATFGIRLGIMRHWEREDRQPQGPARFLPHVLDRRPDAVLGALTESATAVSGHDSRPDPV